MDSKASEAYSIGSKGSGVLLLQQRLVSLGYDVGPKGPDGNFGMLTYAAIKRFQVRNNLSSDGIAGPSTLAVMSAAGAEGEDHDHVTVNGNSILSPAGYQLILDFEVGGGANYYNKHLLHPILPGAYSGITIGIGYDLRYNSHARFQESWGFMRTGGQLTSGEFNRLASFCNRDATKSDCRGLQDITIRYSSALKVFDRETIPRFYSIMLRAFPGAAQLNADTRAALLSLVFNRGGSLNGKTRVEMLTIAEKAVPAKDYKLIAQCLRNMTRWWNGMDVYAGLYRRRYAEAALVEKSVS